MADVRAEWGHEIETPEGRVVRIPNVFPELKQLGLVRRNRDTGRFQLRPLIYEFLHPDYDGLMGPLRRVLGTNLSGPEWVVCECRECQKQKEDADRTRLPRTMFKR